MATDDLKEQFADILISFQQGNIDLADALSLVRDMVDDPEEFDDPDPDGDEETDEPDADGEPETEPEPEEETPDPLLLEAAAAELDAALALVPGMAPAAK